MYMCAHAVNERVNNAFRITVWIFISFVLVTVTRVLVSQSPRWCTHVLILRLYAASLLWYLLILSFYPRCVHVYTFIFDVILMLCVCLRVEESADLFIASVTKSHHISRIDSSSSPLCIYDLQLMLRWQSSQTLCFNSSIGPAGETGALNMNYPSPEFPLLLNLCVCVCVYV